MSVYLLPPNGDFDALSATLKRAGVPLLTPQTIREFIMETEGSPVVFASMQVKDLLVLNRHASTLVVELPSVVMSVPGLAYDGEWVSVAAALPSVDWKEIEKKVAKSGFLANTPDQLESRDRGARVGDGSFGKGRISLTSSTTEALKPEASNEDEDDYHDEVD